MKAKAILHFKDLPKEYAGLCRLLMPRPIHDAVAYRNITEITDAMALWQDSLTPDQQDYFDLLCTLIEDYDQEQPGWIDLPVRERLQHLVNESGMSAADLSRVLGGSRNLGAMILRGERNLTLPHIRKLSEHFHVGPELFV